MRHPATKFPIAVASCQFPAQSPQIVDETLKLINNLSDDRANAYSYPELYEGEAEYSIDWDEINNLDLDFDVQKCANSDCLDEAAPNDCYSMNSGLCLIINNEHFYDNDRNEMPELRRWGTDMDASRLKKLFEQMRFKVRFEYDLSEKDIKSAVQSLVSECHKKAANYDSVCLVILSHGTDGYIYGTDFENKINLDKDVLNLFDDVLIGKPKLFIFQACRGENFNLKLDCSVEEAIASKFREMRVVHKSERAVKVSLSCVDFIDGRPIRTSLPSRSDFFIWYSSVRGFVSHRDTDGSPFIKCLVAVFSRHARDLELVEMVRKVNLLMQQYEKKHCDEMNAVSSYFMLPVPEYHLTKHLYFNP